MQLINTSYKLRNMPLPNHLIIPHDLGIAQVCKPSHVLIVVSLLNLLLHKLFGHLSLHTLIIISNKSNSVDDVTSIPTSENLSAFILVDPLPLQSAITPTAFGIAAVRCVKVFPRSFPASVCIFSGVLRAIRPNKHSLTMEFSIAKRSQIRCTIFIIQFSLPMEFIILKFPNILAAHICVCSLLLLPFLEHPQECISIFLLLLTFPMLEIIFKASLVGVTPIEQPTNSISLPVSNITFVSGSISHDQLPSPERHSLYKTSDIHTPLWKIEHSNSMRQGILSSKQLTFHSP